VAETPCLVDRTFRPERPPTLSPALLAAMSRTPEAKTVESLTGKVADALLAVREAIRHDAEAPGLDAQAARTAARSGKAIPKPTAGKRAEELAEAKRVHAALESALHDASREALERGRPLAADLAAGLVEQAIEAEAEAEELLRRAVEAAGRAGPAYAEARWLRLLSENEIRNVPS